MAAPAYLGSNAVEAYNGSATLSVPVSGHAAGDLIVFFGYASTSGFHPNVAAFSGSHTGGAGSVVTVAEAVTSNVAAGIYLKEATGSETAMVWNMNSGSNVSAAYALVDAGTWDTAWLAAGTFTSGVDYLISAATGNSLTNAGVTPAVDECLGVSFFGSCHDSATSPASGWTERQDESNGFPWCYLQTKALTTSATGAVTLSPTTSDYGDGVSSCLIAIPPVSGGGGGTKAPILRRSPSNGLLMRGRR
jgi:hypothetical protein